MIIFFRFDHLPFSQQQLQQNFLISLAKSNLCASIWFCIREKLENIMLTRWEIPDHISDEVNISDEDTLK